MACAAWSLPHTYSPDSRKCGNRIMARVVVVHGKKKLVLCQTHHREWFDKGAEILSPRLKKK